MGSCQMVPLTGHPPCARPSSRSVTQQCLCPPPWCRGHLQTAADTSLIRLPWHSSLHAFFLSLTQVLGQKSDVLLWSLHGVPGRRGVPVCPPHHRRPRSALRRGPCPGRGSSAGFCGWTLVRVGLCWWPALPSPPPGLCVSHWAPDQKLCSGCSRGPPPSWLALC